VGGTVNADRGTFVDDISFTRCHFRDITLLLDNVTLANWVGEIAANVVFDSCIIDSSSIRFDRLVLASTVAVVLELLVGKFLHVAGALTPSNSRHIVVLFMLFHTYLGSTLSHPQQR
jgi:hypothetical protein